MPSLIPLSDIEPQLVEDLLDEAFGAERKNRTAYKMREGTEMLERLCFAAVDMEEEIFVGSIQCWPAGLTASGDNGQVGKTHPMIMVGPVAVHPDFQGQAIGQALMHATLNALEDGEALPLIMIGDPEYYDRFFGFSPSRTAGWSLPGPCEPNRLLLRAKDDLILPERGIVGPWLR